MTRWAGLPAVAAAFVVAAAAWTGAGWAATAAPAAPPQEPVPEAAQRAAPAVVPFGVGEEARYRVSYNVIGRVGTGTMQIAGVDTVRGRPAYHVLFTLRGGVPLARVDNRFESWMDVAGIHALRFQQNTRELRFRREREREFFPAERRWTGHTNGRPETGTLGTGSPLDDTSFLYFVRTLPLEVGREYSFNRYWNEAGNPVRLRVLRRERVTVPAGTFNTIVVQPIIQTSGMFSDGGEAEVYFAEDGARQVVMLRARVSFGTLQMQLEEFTPGRRLTTRPFVPVMPAGITRGG
jgi:hypothetical protein